MSYRHQQTTNDILAFMDNQVKKEQDNFIRINTARDNEIVRMALAVLLDKFTWEFKCSLVTLTVYETPAPYPESPHIGKCIINTKWKLRELAKQIETISIMLNLPLPKGVSEWTS